MNETDEKLRSIGVKGPTITNLIGKNNKRKYQIKMYSNTVTKGKIATCPLLNIVETGNSIKEVLEKIQLKLDDEREI